MTRSRYSVSRSRISPARRLDSRERRIRHARWSASAAGSSPCTRATDGLRELAPARHRSGRRRVQRLPLAGDAAPVRAERRAAHRGDELLRFASTSARRSPTSCARSSNGAELAPSERFVAAPRDGRTSRSRSRRPTATRRTTAPSATSTATASTRSSCIRSAAGATTRSAARPTDPILEAYKLDGTLLWRIDLGQEHPRGRALHAVHGLRPRRRRHAPRWCARPPTARSTARAR